ncbi:MULTISPECIES: hypothetical protein [Pseudomonadota]|uniref:hypothetical protein n=1 Tax=Pseudomonadota TaxID=1224 RepID=UPI001595AE97|nr:MULTISPECIES: hypothetical protein [Pseudomonadota]MBN9357544.1 hypothetical protein [Herbaspirillum huttiense]
MDRIKEPSTWAGLGILAQVLKGFFPAYALALDGVSAAAGALAGVLTENKGKAA